MVQRFRFPVTSSPVYAVCHGRAHSRGISFTSEPSAKGKQRKTDHGLVILLSTGTQWPETPHWATTLNIPTFRWHQALIQWFLENIPQPAESGKVSHGTCKWASTPKISRRLKRHRGQLQRWGKFPFTLQRFVPLPNHLHSHRGYSPCL